MYLEDESHSYHISKEITTTPALFGDVLEYEGKFYKVGTVRQEVKDTKVEDDSFYLLTLAAVAKELKRRGLAESKVFLAVGLPLTRFGAEKNDFIKYLTKNKRVSFKYENEPYHIEIDDVAVFPQCYAAVVDKIPAMAKKTLIVDIGSWTIDIMPVINKSPDESKCVTIPKGLITCMRSINEQCVRQLNGEVDESEIQNIMRYGRSDIDDEYFAIIKAEIGSTDKCGTGVNVQTHLVAMHHVDCPWKPSSIEQREGRGIRQGNENEEVAIYRYVTKGTFDAYNWSLVENKQRFISQVMTSKAVSRSCEDIDEATLSYAEIKAVATGNPLIKEKMEIDNDVQRLKLLKASYDNQRYGLQDNFMIKYPKLIKTATEKLANVREDVKARDKELIDNPEFAITIGKATYTERVDGGTMMLEAISKCKTGETTAIGKFHGFELLVEKNFLDINYMVLRGKTEYKAELSTSPVGSMVKLENLFNGLNENIDFLEKKIEQYQNDLEASKAEYDKPFAYSKELEEKLARQCELNAQLDLENAKAVDADLSGPEEEREADDRMESAAIVAEDKGAYTADREGRTR